MANVSEPILYHLITWGCQMNVADSERIAGVLESLGGRAAAGEADANLIVINTCMVRRKPEEKLFHKLRELNARRRNSQPDLRIVVAGCASQSLQDGIFREGDGADVVIGPRAIAELPQLLGRLRQGETRLCGDFEAAGEDQKSLPVRRFLPHAAFVTVMMGCNNFCSYCIVPYTRGREFSFSASGIEAEVRKLLADGVREITLLGQNVNSWQDGAAEFPDLLLGLDSLPGDFRLRFVTSHPKDMSPRLIDLFRTARHLAPHVHLPVQSGSDRILKAMNRGYDVARYESLVQDLRRACPQIGLTTDLIVGFPGETEDDFQATCTLVERVGFDAAFTFHYSEREGTAACNLPDAVPLAERKRRLDMLIEQQNRITRRRNEACIGRCLRVLVEGPARRDGEWQTRSGDHRVVIIPREPGTEPGQFLEVEITESTGFALKGKRIPARRTPTP